MTKTLPYSMEEASEIAQMLLTTNKRMHHTELFSMIYGNEIPASQRKEKILNVMQFASKSGFLCYYEDGFYILIEKKAKEESRFSWKSGCLLRWVQVNGVGGIHALWGR